jgi:hypothetical protein
MEVERESRWYSPRAMKRPSPGTRIHGAFATFAAGGLLFAWGCERDLPDPPDPNEPTPVVGCDDGGPLTFTRTTADSALLVPPWVELCTLCPADQLSVSLADPDGDLLPSVTGWARGTECAVAMPTVPIPDAGVIDATFGVVAGTLAGEVTVPVVVGGERGDDPPDIEEMTFVLEWDVARGRHPVQGDPRLLDPAPGPSLLVSFGPPDGDGLRSVTVGATDSNGDVQDLCVPTRHWGFGRSVRRQLAAELVPGAEILQPTPIPVLRGAFQGRLNEEGTGLFDIAILGVVDATALEPLLGPAAEFCESLAAADEASPCGPCGDPSEGVVEEQHCFTAVWEWAAAARAAESLQPVDADALPADCTREH